MGVCVLLRGRCVRVSVGVLWVVLVLVCFVCFFAWVGVSGCPMDLVGKLPDEAGHVCI